MSPQTTSADTGSGEEDLTASYDGAAFAIGFNARYLVDIAQRIRGNTTEVQLGDSASPAVVRDPEDASALYVLMPMRV